MDDTVSTSPINDIVWLSLDPVKKNIDYYPKPIAQKIENMYNMQTDDKFCYLGFDFYNATIHLNNNGKHIQTTPGYSLGRSGYKKAGLRDVRRVIVPSNKKIFIYTKFVNGDIKIDDDKINSLNYLMIDVPNDCIIQNNTTSSNNVKINPWKPEDLEPQNSDLEKNVIIWQWCRGIKEKQGNLMKLNDDWWIPYLYDQNKQIEDAFERNELGTTIVLPLCNEERSIKFIPNSTYGKQKDLVYNNQRLIRRKTVTIQKLIELIYIINKRQPIDVSMLKSQDEIPHDFICCISQDIMTDPVKTIDGFTYDRNSIEKWFECNNKSPSTGLELISKTLISDIDLRIKIENFTKLNNGKN